MFSNINLLQPFGFIDTSKLQLNKYKCKFRSQNLLEMIALLPCCPSIATGLRTDTFDVKYYGALLNSSMVCLCL